MISKLLERIERRESIVAVVGLGYVGLPLALRFCESGFRILGLDIDEAKTRRLNDGVSYIDYIGAERVARAIRTGRFQATTDFSRIAEAEAIVICVPTPLGKHREPDLSYLKSTSQAIAKYLRRGQVISLESTTYPGTTEEVFLPILKQCSLVVGTDAFLVFSPERVDPGNSKYDIERIPKIVGGVTGACRDVGVALYGTIVERTVAVSSPRVAELAKLLENIYRSVNIGLVNELKIVADRMDIDIWEVIEAAATKPFGFMPFYPGPGLGGHCIPIDPFYLTWKAREYGVHTRFIELAGEINSNMPAWVVGKATDALNERGIALKGAQVLVLGLAYKKNIDDCRESPALELIQMLREKGAHVRYADPHIPVKPATRNYTYELQAVPVTAVTIGQADCVVLVTDHDDFDYELIGKEARLIIDTRGRFRKGQANVVAS